MNPLKNFAASVAETCSTAALEVERIAYTDTGWSFTFRGTAYTMPEPYPVMIDPTDERAPRFCIKSLINGSAKPTT